MDFCAAIGAACWFECVHCCHYCAHIHLL